MLPKVGALSKEEKEMSQEDKEKTAQQVKNLIFKNLLYV